MSLFTIADLHLSFGLNKPMNIFKGWDNHVERLTENWNNAVKNSDTVVIAGDISWASTFDEALLDFEFINNKLSGKKIIIKGNHDFWWDTAAKMENFIKENNFDKISFLHNNAFLIGSTAVAGTRGWISDGESENCKKIQKREAARLEMSVLEAKKFSDASEIIVIVHYPLICGDFRNYEMIDVLQKYNIKRCYYGHLHGGSHKKAVMGIYYGVEFSLISADFVNFKPLIIEKS